MSPGMGGVGGMTPIGNAGAEDALVRLINWLANPDEVRARLAELLEAHARATDAAAVLEQAEANVRAERQAADAAAALAKDRLAEAEAHVANAQASHEANAARATALDERERAFNLDSSARLADLNAREKALDERAAKLDKRSAHAEKMLADAEALREQYQARAAALGEAMKIAQGG